MMQPYAGPGMGFHAPLHKGTEVLLSFIDGDPDRPVIAGAVPNADTPGPVRDENQTQVRLVSGGGNILHMEDEKGRERILLHLPTAGSFIRIGARNDPDDDHESNKLDDVEDPQGDCMSDNTEGIKVHSEKNLTFESGDMCTIVHGDEFIRVDGDERYIIDGSTEEFVQGAETTMVGGNVFEGVMGAGEEAFIGAKTELALSGVFELTGPIKGEVGYGSKWSFHEMEEKFIAEENTLEGIKHHLAAQIGSLTLEHEKLVGSVNEMAVESSNLAAEVWNLNVSHKNLHGVVTEMAGENNEFIGESLANIGVSMESRGEHIMACGSKLCTIAEDTKLAGFVEVV